MKANRSQRQRGEDDAVSPVIAVILMVAITVVLAATVYVWVSGFGTSNGTPAKSMSLTSGGSLQADSSANSWKNYTVASATSGMKWTDIKLTLNGNTLGCYSANANFAGNSFGVSQAGAFVACNGAQQGPNSMVAAGDRLQLFVAGGGMSGQTLRILDSQANSIILTLVVG